jgi:hypothetical protein
MDEKFHLYIKGSSPAESKSKSFQRIFNTATIIFSLINVANTNNVSRIEGENAVNSEEIMEEKPVF